ncbi:hypothetical protein JCM19300_58 [Algibacter lectus]|uniref:Uncharacterized protein n=1 Tax=Algibacter lectus TaxID=221126 RepID=A0A090VLY8_9FLAO|nr:hypothetical protein JCM19300_58 [Algibacter lectus]
MCLLIIIYVEYADDIVFMSLNNSSEVFEKLNELTGKIR